MSYLFYSVSGVLFVISVIGGFNRDDAGGNATRVLIASGIFAIAGVLA